MDFEWVAIGLGDVAWIALAFVLGMLAQTIGLPPLVGFLVAGFALSTLGGVVDGELMSKLADLGITLLLFTVGLKLNLRTLARPQVWGVTLSHMACTVLLFGLLFVALGQLPLAALAGFTWSQGALLAFGLSFSSTVFVVKGLEARGAVTSLHGRIAIGILLMQDLAAVLFLALSTGKVPSWWALALLLLPLLRPGLGRLLDRAGHGELLVLYGLLLALGGARVFELFGMKGDLGALALGVLVASHARAEEMAKAMLGFKDLFLLGFFLSIGMAGPVTLSALWIGLALTPLMLLKTGAWFALLTAFRLRARTATLASFNLSNYSEFGLIVVSIAVAKGWLGELWLTATAIALATSFVIASLLTTRSNDLYTRFEDGLRRFERHPLVHDDRLFDLGDAKVAVIGMGGVGTGAYDGLSATHGEAVVGVDIDPVTVNNQVGTGRRVLLGDPSDVDFWDRLQAFHHLELVMITVPKMPAATAVVRQLRNCGYSGPIACTARFPDEEQALHRAGADTVFNIYSEAGAGFAAHASEHTALENSPHGD